MLYVTGTALRYSTVLESNAHSNYAKPLISSAALFQKKGQDDFKKNTPLMLAVYKSKGAQWGSDFFHVIKI